MDKKKKKRGGMKHGGKHERVRASMGRKMYNEGGMYKNGEMPKAKPL